jgi:tetratricopeptide (TPR) repeat protein
MYERARARPPAFASPSEALEWLESEQDCLCSAVTASSDLGLAALSWQLCEALWGLFANRKYFRPWIRTHEAGIEAARDDGNRRAEARMRMQLGLAFRHLRQFGKAREQYTLALALDQAENHRVGEATELEQLGLTDLAEGRHDAAIREFALGKDIFKEIGVPRGAAMMTCHIGEAHRDGGRYREAIRDLAEARSMFAALPDPYNEARTVAELGRAHLSAGDHVEAERLLTTALDAMTSLDSPYEQARIRVVLAGISDGRGDESSARSHLELALAVYDALGAPEAEQVRTALSVLGVAPDSGVSGPDASQ